MDKEEVGQEEAKALKAEGPPVLRFDIRYHYAHTGHHQKPSVIDINQEEETIKINEAPFFLGNHVVVKFSSQGIKTILNEGTVINEEERFKYNDDQIKDGKLKTNDNLSLEIDTYSGTVTIRYTVPRYVSLSIHQGHHCNDDPYIYNEKIGYSERVKDYLDGGRTDLGIGPQLQWMNNYKPADDFGYIMESPPRMMTMLFKGLAFVENLQRGIMKFRTSSFDPNGYVVQLFPLAILEITQTADRIKALPLEGEIPIKEVREEKDDNFELVANESAEPDADLLGNNVEA
jgi:hypothetical protein